MLRRLLLATLALLPLAALAAPPAPYTARYEVWRNGSALGEATVTFRAVGDGRYELRTHTVGTGGLAALAGVDVDERSLLRWVGDRPETVSYRYRQQLAWKTRERSLDVDAARGHIDSMDKGEHTALPYRPGVLDRHAVTVALMQDLALNPAAEPVYPVAGRGSVEAQRFRAGASAVVTTALGDERALRVERVRDSGDGRNTVIWLGLDRRLVPLRVEQTEPNGDQLEMRIVSLR